MSTVLNKGHGMLTAHLCVLQLPGYLLCYDTSLLP